MERFHCTRVAGLPRLLPLPLPLAGSYIIIYFFGTQIHLDSVIVASDNNDSDNDNDNTLLSVCCSINLRQKEKGKKKHPQHARLENLPALSEIVGAVGEFYLK